MNLGLVELSHPFVLPIFCDSAIMAPKRRKSQISKKKSIRKTSSNNGRKKKSQNRTMAANKKKPAFVSYVKVKHTGLSPYKSNLGMDEPKPTARRRRLDFAATNKAGQEANKPTRKVPKNATKSNGSPEPVYAVKKEKPKAAGVQRRDPRQVDDKENNDPQQNKHICNSTFVIPEFKDRTRNEPEPGCSAWSQPEPGCSAWSQPEPGCSAWSQLLSAVEKVNTVGEHITFNRARLTKETINLKNLSDYWDKYQQENSLPIDVLEEIDTLVGQTRLLLRSKFKQFDQLIQSASHDSHILPNDLDGFWDMIYIQVDILNGKFAHLADLERDGWPEEFPDQITEVKRSAKKIRKNKIVAKSRFRQALAAKKAKEQQEMENPEPDITVMPKQTFLQRLEEATVSFTNKPPTTPLVHNNILAAQRSAKRSSSIGAIIRLSFYGKLKF